MSKNHKHIIISFLLLVFINFTFAIQYINVGNNGISITELVEEEEEKEIHEHNLLELLMNNVVAISFSAIQIKETVIEAIVTEVSTPPPELA
ncbi:MAG: hypothetical protein ACPGSL_04125 [Vicingaceae bacterium]